MRTGGTLVLLVEGGKGLADAGEPGHEQHHIILAGVPDVVLGVLDEKPVARTKSVFQNRR